MVSVNSHVPVREGFDQQDLDAWLAALKPAYSDDERKLLGEAGRLVLAQHGEERLASGEIRIRHALSVADILAKLRMDADPMLAAILVEVRHDPQSGAEALERAFGAGVAQMVQDLAQIQRLTRENRGDGGKGDPRHAENLRRLILGIPRDVRVVLIVVADQLHRMRYAKGLDEADRVATAHATKDIYAPLANRLGIAQIKWELEDLALRYLEPESYKRIAKLLDGRRQEREGFIAEVIELLQRNFAAIGIRGEISGRPKHINSIWRKMERKGVGFEQIFDMLAVRVLVDEIADCYAALGVVHGLWKPIPGEFDDYIANPKLNMYQSIHTAVVGPEGKPLEIQIRTRDMHQHAEFGVAAHWRYKESTKHDADFDRRIVWMRHWLELKDEGGESGVAERLGAEIEPALVYVFTPQGKVIELPRGATPLDFAYAIHSEVGNRCRGAKVDGRIVPLTHRLSSGETLEILTAKNGEPSRDWINPQHGYLVTARARNRVRQWSKRRDFDRHLSAGRASLERELNRLGIDQKPDLDRIAGHYNFKRGEDVFAAIGRGDLSALQVLGALGEGFRPPPKRRSRQTPDKPLSRGGNVIVQGVGDVLTHLAHCCKPVPPEPIVGFITRGRGVTVHRRQCANVLRMDGEDRARLVEVSWGDQPPDTAYPVDILVRAEDRKGLLRDLSSVFTNEDLDLIGVQTLSDRETETASMRFTVEINDVAQLDRLLTKVSQLPGVLKVVRQS
jgi:GTP pyrophosphokinase